MMKVFGLALLVVFCSLCGVLLAGGLKKRTEALKKAQLFLHLLGDRLSYTLSPVDEVFNFLSGETLLESLDFIPLCASALARREPFPEALRESVEGCQCALDTRDRMLLCELCGIVGASSLDSQLEGISLVKANLAEQLRAAQEDADKRSRLYTSLGVLSGIALAIVLI